VIDQPETPARRRLVVQPRAREEIAEAHRWYETQRPGLGAEFMSALDAILKRVHREPALHPQVHGHIRRALLRRFPYGVFYAESDDAVLIVAVVHVRQDPAGWPARPSRGRRTEADAP